MKIIGKSVLMSSERVSFNGLSAKTITERLNEANITDALSGEPLLDKWKRAGQDSRVTYLVCDAFEVSPYYGSRHILLCEKSFLIIEGIYAAAKSAGIDRCFICLNEADTEALDALRKEWEASDAEDVTMHFVGLVNTIVSGEESHLKQALLKDMKKNGLASTKSFYESNTVDFELLTESMETLVSVAMCLREEEPDSKLMHIYGEIPEESYIELSSKSNLKTVLERVIGDTASVKAVQVDGLTGPVLFDIDVPVGKNPVGLMSDGSLKIFSEKCCPVDMARLMAEEMRRHSCGKCVFCREGLLQIELILKDISESKGSSEDMETLETLTTLLANYASCDYGKACGRTLVSLLQNDKEVVLMHIEKRRCAKLVCKSMFTVHISAEHCQGCGKCKEVCPRDAIEGESGLIHIVETSKCDNCLLCEAQCPYQAVIRAGFVKPNVPTTPIPVGTYVVRKRGLMNRNKKEEH